ncbi:MAG: substrate-binding domain-containing protein [Treponema sp.]|nr:substrate-binding domain-containing protein [Treponema sp.]
MYRALFILVLQGWFLFAACEGPPAADGNPDVLDQKLLERVKVALVCGLAAGDHAQQFLDACAAEGRAMGFTVDTFTAGEDTLRRREFMARLAQADYAGLIFAYGGADTPVLLKPVVERGIKTVTFDALPLENGASPREGFQGLTNTMQDDAALARISLESLLASFDPSRRPVRVIRASGGPGIPFLDRRMAVYQTYIQRGVIAEAAVIRPRNSAFSRGAVRDALAAVLNRVPPGSADAVWASGGEFAKGCADALEHEGREDLKLFSIDISNNIIKMMLKHPGQWASTAAADPRGAGIAAMRLMAAKFAGEPVPDSYTFDARLVNAADLNNAITMGNIAAVVPGWGQEPGLFDQYPWMRALKAAAGKYSRRPPVADRPRQ